MVYCGLDYHVQTCWNEVRTEAGQLIAACPHNGNQILSDFELPYEVRTLSGEVMGNNYDGSQQHARTG